MYDVNTPPGALLVKPFVLPQNHVITKTTGDRDPVIRLRSCLEESDTVMCSVALPSWCLFHTSSFRYNSISLSPTSPFFWLALELQNRFYSR